MLLLQSRSSILEVSCVTLLGPVVTFLLSYLRCISEMHLAQRSTPRKKRA